jgi:integrase
MCALNIERAQRFLKISSDSEHVCIFALALTSGMPPSEYLALSWPDINWRQGTVSIVRTLHRVAGQWVFEEVKRKRSGRLIKLQTWVLEMLRNMQVERNNFVSDPGFKDPLLVQP